MSAPPSADDEDTALLQIYRQSSREDAQGQFNQATRAAILAEAQRAATPRRTLGRRWRAPIWAAAATAVVAVLIVVPQMRQAQPPIASGSAPAPAITSMPANAPAIGMAATPVHSHTLNEVIVTGARRVVPDSSQQAAVQSAESDTREFNAAATAQKPDYSSLLRADRLASPAAAAPANALNVRDDQGRTPLIEAVVQGRLPRVRQLLAQGADPNLADARGRTALQWAREQHLDQIATTLQAAGAHD